ncbi:hypothetical protein V8G54_010834 [Vigna mungo]|uniref:Uncharacterized protein n=1 Tax=Vigna mungo TaxID=3915 RepID=A0AAQ3S588_VIGMU
MSVDSSSFSGIGQFPHLKQWLGFTAAGTVELGHIVESPVIRTATSIVPLGWNDGLRAKNGEPLKVDIAGYGLHLCTLVHAQVNGRFLPIFSIIHMVSELRISSSQLHFLRHITATVVAAVTGVPESNDDHTIRIALVGRPPWCKDRGEHTTHAPPQQSPEPPLPAVRASASLESSAANQVYRDRPLSGSMVGFSLSMTSSSSTTPLLVAHHLIPQYTPLDSTNYATWASDIKLWLKSQGYVDHFTQNDLFTVIGSCSPGPMAEYLGKVHALLHDFNELLPPASTPAEELEQRSKFFMLLALDGFSDDFSHVRDQILGFPVIPNFTSNCSAVLRIQSKPVTKTSPRTDDSSVMATQRDDQSRSRKPGKGRPKCDHCGKLGHKKL